MIVLALASGSLALWQRGSRERADLVVWCFSDSHLRAFKGDGTRPEIPPPVEVFQNETGKSVDVQLIANRALNLRMSSIFMSNISSEIVPDLVTIEIWHVGKFFRPPVEQIGFLPLNDLLKEHGWHDRLIAARLAPWSKDGVIFGVPNDVHPVSLT